MRITNLKRIAHRQFPKGIILVLLMVVVFSAKAQPFINPQFSHFTINNGLSQNLIFSITQDQTGFMWFGTKDGLNRYDGYEFKAFHHDPLDTSSISDNTVTVLFTDSKGRLWVGTMNGNIDLYEKKFNTFEHLLRQNANKGNISAITEDPLGNIWVGTYGNGIFKLVFNKTNFTDKPDNLLHYVSKPGDSTTLINNMVYDVMADRECGIWASVNQGLFQYARPDKSGLKFSIPALYAEQVERKFTPQGLQYDLTRRKKVDINSFKAGRTRFLEDSKHRIWMSSPRGFFLFDRNGNSLLYFDPQIPGLIRPDAASLREVSLTLDGEKRKMIAFGFATGAGILDTKRFALQVITHDPENPNSLSPQGTVSIYQDKSGCIWLGSSGYGLNKFNTRSALFPLPDYHTADNKIRTKNLSVRSFLNTKDYLFIGSQTSLMMANKATLLMQPVIPDGKSLAPSQIFSMVSRDSQSCWITTTYGLILFDYKRMVSQIYPVSIRKNEQVDNRIFKLLRDKQGNLWCLTPYSISYFNTRLKTFTNYFFEPLSVVANSEPTYGDIYQEPSGNLWLGTEKGLLNFDLATKKFTRYTSSSNDPNSLSFNSVRTVLADPTNPAKFLWIATAGGGLNQFDLQTKKFTRFTEKDGLPNNFVYGILSDSDGNLWMSTNRGISKFNPATKVFTNFDVSSGLQSNEFNSGAFYKDDNGDLYFGGINGFNSFSPGNVKPDNFIPQLAFTSFNLFNRPVSAGEKGSPLKFSITETKEIVLPFSDNIISFEVAALDFTEPGKMQYAYRLVPSNSNWIQMGNNRLITISNLEPGNYTLQVKAGNLNGTWNEKGISLKLIILPPWWRAWWAYLLYFCMLVGLLYIIRKFELRRVKLRNRLQVEHLESEKLKEMDRMKSRFFANISHEFRTPLTLIMGPVEDMLRNGNAEEFKRILPDVYRNSKRLLQLINQLLDLSRLDSRKYLINTTREDIIPFVERITGSFRSLAERKNIELKFEADANLKERLEDGETRFYFDEDMIEKIVSNLISNAIKFTGDSGHVHVGMKVSGTEKDFLELSVRDSGIGIPPEKIPFVFNRFYQADDSDERRYEGSGVGLALLKEMVDLLHGKVAAESELDKGAAFFCYLPFNQKIITGKISSAVQEVHTLKEESLFGEPELKEEIAEDRNRDIVLLVEDQDDMRRYIREKLDGTYSVAEAGNGNEALELARERIPDLVVTDVMMPGMDGFQLCEKLKSDPRTSHIPIIMLTARADDKDRMEGLETGADAYLIKPFNSLELQIRVRKLIEIRKKLKARFSDRLVVKPSEITITSVDQEFMRKLMISVENHISDFGFSVADLAGEMSMSLSQLNRKLKAVIDQTPQKFIRSVRMQRALEMLRKEGGNISEVAWKTGFEDPSYFSRVFKTYFGCHPSEKEKFPADQA